MPPSEWTRANIGCAPGLATSGTIKVAGISTAKVRRRRTGRAAADAAAQPHEAFGLGIAAHDFEHEAGLVGQQLACQHCLLLRDRPERAQQAAAGIEHLDVLDRHGGEHRAAHQIALRRRATVDAAAGKLVERGHGAADPCFRNLHRAVGKVDGILLRLALDQIAEPEVEGDQRPGGQHHTEQHRDQALVLQTRLNRPHCVKDRTRHPIRPAGRWRKPI